LIGGVVTVNGGQRFLLRYERASSNRSAARCLSDRKEDETTERWPVEKNFLGRVPAMRCVGDLERSHVMIVYSGVDDYIPIAVQISSHVPGYTRHGSPMMMLTNMGQLDRTRQVKKQPRRSHDRTRQRRQSLRALS